MAMRNKFTMMDKTELRFRAFKKRIPGLVAKLHVNFFKRNFTLGGFMDRTLEPWEPNAEGTRTLVDTGNLRRSIHADIVRFNRIRIVSKLPYAAQHNYGIGVPERKFMGFSDVLYDKTYDLINRELRKVFKDRKNSKSKRR